MLRICDNQENIDMFERLQGISSKKCECVFWMTFSFNKAIMIYENVIS